MPRAPLRPIAGLLFLVVVSGCSKKGTTTPPPGSTLPEDIQAIMAKPRYAGASFTLRVVDLDTGEVVHALDGKGPVLIGSVRKVVSVGLALEALGADHRFSTPVYAQGDVDAQGVLTGDLILVGAGDLVLGGRGATDGTIAYTAFDHSEANSLGSALLAEGNPLAGIEALAAQISSAEITSVTGEVIVDDRLFEPFEFRGEYDVRPIMVNENHVDVTITPGAVGQPALVEHRPQSTAFAVTSEVETVATGGAVELEPELPSCFGTPGCGGTVSGAIAEDITVPITGELPLVQTFRITDPSAYARTVFIEALEAAGVDVAAPTVAPNPSALPDRSSYGAPVATLSSPPFSEYAKLVLKVSHNLGADLSLIHFGLTKGQRTLADALSAEREILISEYGWAANDFTFVDGSGGGETRASASAITSFLRAMRDQPFFVSYRQALPGLGVDGSLAAIEGFAQSPDLEGARGEVEAKTGTFITVDGDGVPQLEAQALAGYVTAKSGRQLVFFVAVNDAGPLAGIEDVVEVFEDQATISAILWRDH